MSVGTPSSDARVRVIADIRMRLGSMRPCRSNGEKRSVMSVSFGSMCGGHTNLAKA
jgi:hypothetical protein